MAKQQTGVTKPTGPAGVYDPSYVTPPLRQYVGITGDPLTYGQGPEQNMFKTAPGAGGAPPPSSSGGPGGTTGGGGTVFPGGSPIPEGPGTMIGGGGLGDMGPPLGGIGTGFGVGYTGGPIGSAPGGSSPGGDTSGPGLMGQILNAVKAGGETLANFVHDYPNLSGIALAMAGVSGGGLLTHLWSKFGPHFGDFQVPAITGGPGSLLEGLGQDFGALGGINGQMGFSPGTMADFMPGLGMTPRITIQDLASPDPGAGALAKGGLATLHENMQQIRSMPGGKELLLTEAAKKLGNQGLPPRSLRLYCGGGVSKNYAHGGLASAVSAVRNAGRGRDELIVHMSPAEYDAIEAMWGPAQKNPETGLPEYGVLGDTWDKIKGAVKDVVHSPIFQVAGPAILNHYFPDLGSGIGGIFGLSGDTASAAGNAVIGAGFGAAEQGKSGILPGAISGLGQAGYGAKIGEMMGFTGPTANVVGQALLSGAGSKLGGGNFLTGAGSGALNALINPPRTSLAATAEAPPTISPTVTSSVDGGITQASDTTPTVSPSGGIAGGIFGSPSQPAPAPQSAQTQQQSDLQNAMALAKKYAIPISVALSLLSSSSYKKAKAPQLPASYTQHLPTLNFQRTQTPMAGPLDYYTYGQTAPEHSFFTDNSIPAYTPADAVTGNPKSKLHPHYARAHAQGGALGHVAGPGSGRDDHIPAQLSDGEYVMDAETVALLGDGSTAEGARRLDEMRENLRKQKGAALAKGKFSPNAKPPEAYLSMRRAKGGVVDLKSARSFKRAHSAIFGESDEPDWETADRHLRNVQGGGREIADRLRSFRDKQAGDTGEGDSPWEGEEWHKLMDDLDQLGSKHGVKGEDEYAQGGVVNDDDVVDAMLNAMRGGR